MKKGVCALRAALSARLSAREASHRSDTRLRARSPPPFWRRSPRGLHFAAQRCMALPPPAFSPDVVLTSLPFSTVCYKAFFGDLVCAALEFLWCLKTGKALSGEGYGLIRAGASIHVPRPHTKERLPAPLRRGPAAPQASRSAPAAGPCRSLKACCLRRWQS